MMSRNLEPNGKNPLTMNGRKSRRSGYPEFSWRKKGLILPRKTLSPKKHFFKLDHVKRPPSQAQLHHFLNLQSIPERPVCINVHYLPCLNWFQSWNSIFNIQLLNIDNKSSLTSLISVVRTRTACTRPDIILYTSYTVHQILYYTVHRPVETMRILIKELKIFKLK